MPRALTFFRQMKRKNWRDGIVTRAAPDATKLLIYSTSRASCTFFVITTLFSFLYRNKWISFQIHRPLNSKVIS